MVDCYADLTRGPTVGWGWAIPCEWLVLSLVWLARINILGVPRSLVRYGKAPMYFGLMWIRGIAFFKRLLLTVLCPALTTGKLPAVRAVQGDCERDYSREALTIGCLAACRYSAECCWWSYWGVGGIYEDERDSHVEFTRNSYVTIGGLIRDWSTVMTGWF